MPLTPEQIEQRAKGLGGSDAPIVCGLSARCTALDLFYQKQQLIGQPLGLEHEAWIGNQAEPIMDAWYKEHIGKATRRRNRTLLHADPDLSFMVANPDRDVVGERRGLEFKMRARSADWGPDGTDQVPDDVRVQCSHYMAVLNYPLWDVVVWLPPFEFRHYVIERDQETIDYLINIESQFWASVQNDDPPEADWQHATTYGLMQRMFPGTDGGSMRFDDTAQQWHDVYQDARERRIAYSKLEEGARNHLLYLMDYNAIGFMPDGTSYHREIKPDGTIKRFYSRKPATARS